MPGGSEDLKVGIQQSTPEKKCLIGSTVPPEARVFKDRSELIKTVEALRHLNARIVLTSGTFDIAHIGHFKYLENAKSHGDILIVGVDSDEKVRERKGPDRPVVPEEERVAMLAYLRSVDFITVKQRDDPKWDLIKTIRPDTLIITEETYDEETREKLAEFCGEVICLEPQATTSTSARIRKMQVGARQQVVEPISELLKSHAERRRREDEELLRAIADIAIEGSVTLEVADTTDEEPARESA